MRFYNVIFYRMISFYFSCELSHTKKNRIQIRQVYIAKRWKNWDIEKNLARKTCLDPDPKNMPGSGSANLEYRSQEPNIGYRKILCFPWSCFFCNLSFLYECANNNGIFTIIYSILLQTFKFFFCSNPCARAYFGPNLISLKSVHIAHVFVIKIWNIKSYIKMINLLHKIFTKRKKGKLIKL